MDANAISASLTSFLSSPINSVWLHDDNKIFQVYVRKSRRLIGYSIMHPVFDVSNVNVAREHQQQGLFKSWLKTAELIAKQHGFVGVYVESILNPHLVAFLLREGYVVVGDLLPPNMYKHL